MHMQVNVNFERGVFLLQHCLPCIFGFDDILALVSLRVLQHRNYAKLTGQEEF